MSIITKINLVQLVLLILVCISLKADLFWLAVCFGIGDVALGCVAINESIKKDVGEWWLTLNP